MSRSYLNFPEMKSWKIILSNYFALKFCFQPHYDQKNGNVLKINYVLGGKRLYQMTRFGRNQLLFHRKQSVGEDARK